jgi:endoglucanase
MPDLSLLADDLRCLDAIPGVSGFEETIGDHLAQRLAPFSDRQESDALGNRFFHLDGSAPDFRVMLCAHMDEIGFVASHIDEGGFVFMVPAGFQDPRVCCGQAYAVHGRRGPVPGVAGQKPVHLLCSKELRRSVPLGELYLDLGTTSRAETEALGVLPGDPITFDRPPQVLNGRLFCGKAVDNRSGCVALIHIMAALHARRAAGQLVPSVCAVATVQEELGIRGAGPAACRLQPDLAIALDVTFAGGSPGIDERKVPVKLGGGPAVKLYDWSPCNAYIGNVVPRKLVNRLLDAAWRHDIPVQREVVIDAGTDAWAVSLAGSGVLTGSVCLPSRYIHSAVGCISLEDLANVIRLTGAFIGELEAPI